MVRRSLIRTFMIAALSAAGCLYASAQSNKGTITPVDSDDEAPQKPVLHYYDKHGNKLDKPVLYLAELDTMSTSSKVKSPYPLYNGITVGVNFADAILRLTGQKHSSYDISAMVSLHNWFFPIVEAGIGWGSHTEGDNLYHYKARPAFYAKAGINYNFLYKSKTDYMAYVGLRFGVTSHNWDIRDISPTSDLGKETGKTELLDQHCVSTYGEVVAGLKVKVAGPFSMGWNVRYRIGLHNSGGASPWFVPGYGTGPLGVNLCAYLTFGEKKKKEKTEDEEPLPDVAPTDMTPAEDTAPADNAPAETSPTESPLTEEASL